MSAASPHPTRMLVRVARSGGWTAAATAASFVGMLSVNALLARLLTPTELGAYFLAITLITSATALATLGLPRWVTRQIAHHVAIGQPEHAGGAVVTGFRLALAGGGVIALAIATWPGRWIAEGIWHSELLAPILVIAAIAAWAEALRTESSEALRGLHEYRAAALTGEGARSVIGALLVGGAALVLSDVELRTAVGLAAGASLVIAVSALFRLRARLRALGPPVAMSAGVALAGALPLLVTEITALVLNFGDVWVVGASESARDVAVYAAAVRVVMLIRVPMYLVSVAISPMVAELNALSDVGRLERLVRGTAFLGAIPVLIIVPAFAIFGRSILTVLYGSFYAAGWSVLVILSVGEAFNAITGSTATSLTMTGHQRALMRCAILAGAATIAGELLLVGPFGLPGVAAASAGGVVLFHTLLAVTVRRHVGIWTFASVAAVRGLRSAMGKEGS